MTASLLESFNFEKWRSLSLVTVLAFYDQNSSLAAGLSTVTFHFTHCLVRV